MKLIEKEFNAITGEITITEREETAPETKARLEREKEKAAEKEAADVKAIQKAALLEKLGITEDEARLLIG
jgi:hypothetical protein